MYTIEFDFDLDEDSLENIDTFIGVHESCAFEADYTDSLKDILNRYVEKGPENHMKVVGTNSEQENSYENFEVFRPSSAEIYGEDNEDLNVPGVAPVYLNDLQRIHSFLEENRDIDEIVTRYATEFGATRGSFEDKKDEIASHVLEIQKRWPEITWQEIGEDTINTWTYRKGEVKVLSGERIEDIGEDDLDQEEAIKYVMSEAPFQNQEEYQDAQNSALTRAGAQRKPGKEEQMAREIEQTGVLASRK